VSPPQSISGVQFVMKKKPEENFMFRLTFAHPQEAEDRMCWHVPCQSLISFMN
jgi:hypothetical protein